MDFAETVGAMSGGRLKIEAVDASKHGAPVGVLQLVREGKFDLGHTTAQYYAGAIPAIDYFSAVPFGLTADELHGWMLFGGGQALFEQIMRKRGIVPMVAGDTAVQMGGRYNREILQPEDFNGMRIRVSGLPGRVLQRLGATPVAIPFGGIADAFAKKEIDGADIVGPAIDATLPVRRHASNYYGPWHEPDVALHVFIDQAKFDALPADLQAIVRNAAQAAALRSISRALTRNAVALRELEADGVKVRQLPAGVIQALKAATEDALNAAAASDPESKQVIESFRAYQKLAAPYDGRIEGAMLGVR
ncbi:MAG: TRAP transporter substrate-binding protein DctP [Candidatus Protistobacter heckmanni]|nr:TRAP transporter substrate-binding protein DctP [Candidatus Protistobacter heckmanni]